MDGKKQCDHHQVKPIGYDERSHVFYECVDCGEKLYAGIKYLEEISN